MEVVSFKLYQRKLVVDDLSAMFYNSRGRERVGLAGGRAGVGGGGGVCWGGGCGGEKGRGEQTDRERFAFRIYLFFNCFAGDCS